MRGTFRAVWLCTSVLLARAALGQERPPPDIPNSSPRRGDLHILHSPKASKPAPREATGSAGWQKGTTGASGEQLAGTVRGGNLPTDLWVQVVDSNERTVGSTDVMADGSFTLTNAHVDHTSKDLKAFFIRKNGDPFAQVKISDWSGGALVIWLPPNAYFRVRLSSDKVEQLDGEVRIDGESTGRTEKLISTSRGQHHLDAGNDRCVASRKKHGFFNLDPKKPEEIHLKCGQQE